MGRQGQPELSRSSRCLDTSRSAGGTSPGRGGRGCSGYPEGAASSQAHRLPALRGSGLSVRKVQVAERGTCSLVPAARE